MSTDEKLDKLLTIEELSRFLNIKISKVRSMIFNKEIPTIKLGRLIRFNKREINQWLSEQRKH